MRIYILHNIRFWLQSDQWKIKQNDVVGVIYIKSKGHYNDVIMSAMASQLTSLTIVYLTVYSGADQRKHQSSATLAFVWGIHRWPVNSPHKWPVTRKMSQFDGVNMIFPRQYGCTIHLVIFTKWISILKYLIRDNGWSTHLIFSPLVIPGGARLRLPSSLCCWAATRLKRTIKSIVMLIAKWPVKIILIIDKIVD